MTIMIIFLVSSVVMVIFTAIYLNQNKNGKSTKNIKNTEEENKKNNKKQLVDILKIKIKGNIICIGNRYSSILRLGNIDYNMLSDKEQNGIEQVLIQTAFSIDYPIQFFSTTENIDTTKIVELMKSNNIANEKIQEYKEYLIKYLQNLMENKTVSVIKNYAIISYDGTYENAFEELKRNAIALKNSLIRANIVCDILDENSLCNLVYRELNKNSNLNIDLLNKGGQNLYVGKEK